MLPVILIIVGGLLLSAFFSGSETGLYRVTRVRLALDGLSGDPVSKGMLWLVNNPALFVATTLIGNNLANYLVSFGVVVGTQLLLGGKNAAAEILAPIIMAPFVFVYAELLPKNLYYLAPNRLLRGGAPLLLLFGVIFSPISAALWLLGRFLQHYVGESPELVRMRLARNELRKLLDEGHDVGILHPIQRQFSQAVFDHGSDAVIHYSTPPGRVSTVSIGDPLATLRRIARRHHVAELVAVDESRKILGYVRVVDLYLNGDNWQSKLLPLERLDQSVTHMVALMKMQENKSALAEIVDSNGRTVGIASRRRLLEPLYRRS